MAGCTIAKSGFCYCCNCNRPESLPLSYGEVVDLVKQADYEAESGRDREKATDELQVDFCPDTKCDCSKFMQAEKTSDGEKD